MTERAPWDDADRAELHRLKAVPCRTAINTAQQRRRDASRAGNLS